MTSTIKVNNIQNQCGQNIINENSNTITIGASGDTIALASGASQTGFGSTGEISWDTTPKTGDFTGVSGVGYFINTAGGTVTVTLPGSPSAGNVIGISDYNSTAATNNITINRNSNKINGATSNLTISKANSAVQLVYIDATTGWQSVFTGSTSDILNTSLVATGGTITECGDCKIHTFTGPGTFTVTNAASGACAPNNLVSYMVVAGGGGGAQGDRTGGAGAGGFRETKSPVTPYTASPLDGYGTPTNRITLTATSYPITVGGGGAKSGAPFSPGNNGSNSIFSTITSTGGGGGGGGPSPSGAGTGNSGGSGGGGAHFNKSGGAGNTPPVSPAQGQNGGNGVAATNAGSGGGGGAGAVGGKPTAVPGPAGVGGAGVTSSITGAGTARAGGGGAGQSVYPGSCGALPGPGGAGGGGAGGTTSGGVAGTVNTGGGGGGANNAVGGPSSIFNGGAGGSGVVIIRYQFQ